jgi:HEAT repeat protein
MVEGWVEKGPCLWETPEGRCANCKARRFRHDALDMKDDYGVCYGQRDYLQCIFYREGSNPEGRAYPEDAGTTHIDLGGMLKGLRSLDVEDCCAALEETMELLTYGLADRALLQPLIALVPSPNDRVRRDASWCLGKLAMLKLGDQRSIGALLSLAVDKDPEVRENAAWALGELAGLNIGDNLSIEVLNIMLTDPQREVRAMAAWALGRIADRMRVTSPCSVPLLRIMLEDENEYLRRGARWSLERIERLRVI